MVKYIKVLKLIIKGRINRIFKGDIIYYAISTIIITLFLLGFIYPIIFIISSSLSSGAAITSGNVILWPVNFSIEGYTAVFRNNNILRAYANTVFYASVGTIIQVSMVMLTAYPLSRRDLKGRKILMFLFVLTMFFSGGMIPNYILFVKLGIINTIWAVIMPGALSVFSVIIVRTYIESNIPQQLFDAAKIDGCNDIKYFTKIILPLTKVPISIVGLFSMVGFWNSYFESIMYLYDRSLMPLQIILREILIMNQIDFSMTHDSERMIAIMYKADVIKYSMIVIAIAPLLFLYPFTQKHLSKYFILGSLKE
jgi:multiple sugar transport system permease protein/putative aldouronate transport system permease protein